MFTSHQYDEDEILIKLNYAGFLLLTKRFSEALLIMNDIAEKKKIHLILIMNTIIYLTDH